MIRRQKLETIWETVEMQKVLHELAELPEEPQDANSSRVTCEEYVAFIALEVTENMDGLAWARVTRKLRPAEIAASYEELDKAQEVNDGHAAAESCDIDVLPFLNAPGLLRKVPYPLTSVSAAMDAIADGPRATAFDKGLTSFLEAQGVLDQDVALDCWPEPTKRHWHARQEAVAALRSEMYQLHCASADPEFVGRCIRSQEQAFKERHAAAFAFPENESESDGDEDAPAGETCRSAAVDPHATWVEPDPGELLPSEYLSALLRSVPKRMLPTTEQLQFLALFGKRLDDAVREEHEGMPWHQRSQHCMLLLGQGGCGKTFLVQHYIARVVKYAFRTPDALRLIAFSNAQAANLSSAEFPAYTMHRACRMPVQKLKNSLMDPKDKLQELQHFWGPARVLILEEFTLCPAEGFNMGLLRSTWGRAAPCQLNVDDYAARGAYWGHTPIVIQLGDPLQLRPVRAVSLLDTKDLPSASSPLSYSRTIPFVHAHTCTHACPRPHVPYVSVLFLCLLNLRGCRTRGS